MQCEYQMSWAAARKVNPRCSHVAKHEVDGKRLCTFHAKRAGSAFLNNPLRTNREAAADITAEQQRAEIAQARTLQEVIREQMRHEPSNLEIYSGAFEPIYSDDGVKIAQRDMDGRIYDLHGNPIKVMGEVA